MPALSDLSYLVRPHIRNCPEPLIQAALLRAARRFCTESRYLRETVDVPLIAEQSAYELLPACNEEEVVLIKAVEYKGNPLAPVSPEEVPAACGSPLCFWLIPPTILYLTPTPHCDEGGALIASVIKQPTKDATSINEDLTQNCDQVLKDGALFELLTMPGAWQDLKRAGVHGSLYEDGMRKHRLRADMQHRPFAFRTRPGW